MWMSGFLQRLGPLLDGSGGHGDGVLGKVDMEMALWIGKVIWVGNEYTLFEGTGRLVF